MGDVQDKSSAYAALDEDDVNDYLADLLEPEEELTCDCQNESVQKLLNRKRNGLLYKRQQERAKKVQRGDIPRTRHASYGTSRWRLHQ